MSSKYDKTISMSREEEGSYHRREIEHSPARPAKTYTTYTTQVVPVHDERRRNHSPKRDGTLARGYESSDNDNFEEWTTSKRKVNHKTRQVETRVSRQLLVEDGKVIADSGPQVTTRIKEDNKVEECEKEKAPKNKSKFDAIESAQEVGDSLSSGRVLGEKKEIKKVSHEVREENMQYHDERFKELTGHDVHRRALQAPHELITITDKDHHSASSAPRGKMVHYSNKGKKYQDTDEILEVAKLAIDGSITKEVKRTRHHEEQSEDELPDETGEAEELRQTGPKVERSSRRHIDTVNDFNDTATPPTSSDDEVEGDPRTLRNKAKSGSRQHQHREHNSAFPRYQIDPLLNSLNDDDFRPTNSSSKTTSGRYMEHPLRKKDRSDSSADEEAARRQYHQQHLSSSSMRPRSQSPYGGSQTRVEIPEEFRVNKQKLIKSKSSARDRSFSPANKSHLSHRSNKSHREDASVQAHLTDEVSFRR